MKYFNDYIDMNFKPGNIIFQGNNMEFAEKKRKVNAHLTVE